MAPSPDNGMRSRPYPFIEFCAVDPAAKALRPATPGSAGFDLFALHSVQVPARGRRLVGTGISVAIPHGFCGQIYPRSSLTVRGITTDAGVIEADYRGEVKVLVVNDREESYDILPGDLIAQLVVLPILTAAIEVESLDKTRRGSVGFRSDWR